jgi:hypothetical protein
MSKAMMINNGEEWPTPYQLQPDSFPNNFPCSTASAVTTQSTMAKDLETFLHTGNCVSPTSATSFNPTKL